jgi:hypothetical protein
MLNSSSSPRFLISSSSAVARFMCVSIVAFRDVNSGNCVMAVFKWLALAVRSLPLVRARPLPFHDNLQLRNVIDIADPCRSSNLCRIRLIPIPKSKTGIRGATLCRTCSTRRQCLRQLEETVWMRSLPRKNLSSPGRIPLSEVCPVENGPVPRGNSLASKAQRTTVTLFNFICKQSCTNAWYVHPWLIIGTRSTFRSRISNTVHLQLLERKLLEVKCTNMVAEARNNPAHQMETRNHASLPLATRT